MTVSDKTRALHHVSLRFHGSSQSLWDKRIALIGVLTDLQSDKHVVMSCNPGWRYRHGTRQRSRFRVRGGSQNWSAKVYTCTRAAGIAQGQGVSALVAKMVVVDGGSGRISDRWISPEADPGNGHEHGFHRRRVRQQPRDVRRTPGKRPGEPDPGR